MVMAAQGTFSLLMGLGLGLELPASMAHSSLDASASSPEKYNAGSSRPIRSTVSQILPATRSLRGPRSLGVRGSFRSAPSFDLPPTIFTRDDTNPFSPPALSSPLFDLSPVSPAQQLRAIKKKSLSGFGQGGVDPLANTGPMPGKADHLTASVAPTNSPNLGSSPTIASSSAIPSSPGFDDGPQPINPLYPAAIGLSVVLGLLMLGIATCQIVQRRRRRRTGVDLEGGSVTSTKASQLVKDEKAVQGEEIREKPPSLGRLRPSSTFTSFSTPHAVREVGLGLRSPSSHVPRLRPRRVSFAESPPPVSSSFSDLHRALYAPPGWTPNLVEGDYYPFGTLSTICEESSEESSICSDPTVSSLAESLSETEAQCEHLDESVPRHAIEAGDVSASRRDSIDSTSSDRSDCSTSSIDSSISIPVTPRDALDSFAHVCDSPTPARAILVQPSGIRPRCHTVSSAAEPDDAEELSSSKAEQHPEGFAAEELPLAHGEDDFVDAPFEPGQLDLFPSESGILDAEGLAPSLDYLETALRFPQPPTFSIPRGTYARPANAKSKVLALADSTPHAIRRCASVPAKLLSRRLTAASLQTGARPASGHTAQRNSECLAPRRAWGGGVPVPLPMSGGALSMLQTALQARLVTSAYHSKVAAPESTEYLEEDAGSRDQPNRDVLADAEESARIGSPHPSPPPTRRPCNEPSRLSSGSWDLYLDSLDSYYLDLGLDAFAACENEGFINDAFAFEGELEENAKVGIVELGAFPMPGTHLPHIRVTSH